MEKRHVSFNKPSGAVDNVTRSASKKKTAEKHAEEKPTGRPTKYCSNCGSKIDVRAEICPKCGVRQFFPQVKSPEVAAILSFLIVGLGQIYCGRIARGIIFFVVGIVCILLAILIIGIPLALVWWIWNVVDAYRLAKRINTKHASTTMGQFGMGQF